MKDGITARSSGVRTQEGIELSIQVFLRLLRPFMPPITPAILSLPRAPCSSVLLLTRCLAYDRLGLCSIVLLPTARTDSAPLAYRLVPNADYVLGLTSFQVLLSPPR